MEIKDVLPIHIALKEKIGENVTFGADASYWYDKGLQEIGELRAVVVWEVAGPTIRIIGKGIDAVWKPFAETIIGKGSKKYTEELAQVGRDAVAWFTRELDSTEQPDPADMIEEDGRAAAAAEAVEWLEETAEEGRELVSSGINRMKKRLIGCLKVTVDEYQTHVYKRTSPDGPWLHEDGSPYDPGGVMPMDEFLYKCLLDGDLITFDYSGG